MVISQSRGMKFRLETAQKEPQKDSHKRMLKSETRLIQRRILRQMDLYTMVRELMERSMDMESKSGQTHPATLETGRTIRQMDLENSSMPMEIFMRVTG